MNKKRFLAAMLAVFMMMQVLPTGVLSEAPEETPVVIDHVEETVAEEIVASPDELSEENFASSILSNIVAAESYHTVSFIYMTADGETVTIGETWMIRNGETLGKLPEGPEMENNIFLGWVDQDGNPVTEETLVANDLLISAAYESLMPATTFHGSANGIEVVVDAPEGAFPAGTTMAVADVSESNVRDTLENFFGEEEEIATIIAVDITFFNADGIEIEPLKEVNVQLYCDADLGTDSKVAHIDSEGAAEVVAEVEEGAALFSAGGFSTYAIVVTNIITVNYLSSTGETYEIEVQIPEEAEIPKGSELHVEEVSVDALNEAGEKYLDAAADKLNLAQEEIRYVKALDIYITKDGEKIQPKVPVSVVIRLLDRQTVTENEGETPETDSAEITGAAEETEAASDPAEIRMQVVHFGETDTKELECTTNEDTVRFDTDGFSIFVIIGTIIIQTPSGELVFKGDGFTVRISYSEESKIPLGTELTVRELKGGSEEYLEYWELTEAALKAEDNKADLKKDNSVEKIDRMLNAFEELRQTNIFDITLVYEGKEIEPDPNYPLSVEITYDTDLSRIRNEEKLDAAIVHFAQDGTEVISDIDLVQNGSGSVTLAYEQNGFSRTAASLLGSYGNGGWIGGNGNTLVFRYGYATIGGEPVFEIQYNGGAINSSTLEATPGSWPGDPGYPHNPQTGVYFDGTCDPGTTMMELIEACNSSALATSASCNGFKVIMGDTYTVNSATGAHSIQQLGTLPRDLRSTIGDSFTLGGTSEEYWYSPNKIFRIERGPTAGGGGWSDSLIYNQGSLPLDILAGIIIDNKSANASSRVSDGSDDSKTGAVYPIAITTSGAGGGGTASASGLTMFFNGCYITDSSYNGTPVGTGVKIVHSGSLEMFSHGNDQTGAASSYIENMAVAVDQISGKTRLKTARDPFGNAHNNTIGVALSYGQSIGKWYVHLNPGMSRVPIWLRSVTSWKSGDIVMDSGWQKAGTVRSPVENTPSYMDINKLNLVNQNTTSTVMGLEFYVGTNQDPYPVIRFYAGTVYNTRTHQWYRTLYDAVTPGRADVTGGATQIADGDTLVFYGNTLESHQIVIDYNVTIRGAYDSETINGTETGRAGLSSYTARLSGASTNWISVSTGKTVTFGGNATTDSNGQIGTVTSGTPGTLILDGGNAVSYDIVNWGTTNLKNNIHVANASVAGVFQDGSEHLYEGATFSGNPADQYLTNGNRYITLETTNPNDGNAVSVYLFDTQFNGRDVVVAGTTQNIQNLLDVNYLAKFPLSNLDSEFDYVYTVNGGPNGERVLELKQKATLTVRVIKLDQDGNPLNGAGFTLYKVQGGTETPYTIGNENNPHVTAGNGRTEISVREGSFKLKETGIPAGYTGDSGAIAGLPFTVTNQNGVLSLSGNGFSLVAGTTDTYQVTVSNNLRKTTVTANKAWNNADGTHTAPSGASVVFTLYADGTTTNQTRTLNAANGWTATFSDLQECRTGTNTPIVYTVKETTTYPGYASNEPSAGVGNNGTITNSQETTTATAAKVWNNADGSHTAPSGASVVFTLYADGTATNQTATLNASNGWTATFGNLIKYRLVNGNAVAIVYTIKETTGYPGYTSSDSSLPSGVASGQSITNTQETTSATATKAWLNADGTTTAPAGASVVFTLYADGTATSKTATLNAQNGWTANFSSIPMYRTGTTTPIVYTVKETTAYPGYDSSDSSQASGVANGGTITNTQRTTTVTASKAWANADGTTTAPSGASVVFTLYEDGTATSHTATLNASNGWTATFSNLPECRTGTNTQIVYTVKETTTYPGYASDEPSDGVGNNGTITNSQETTSATASKTWLNADGTNTAPSGASVVFTLYADGTATNQTATLNASNGWTANFGNLIKYRVVNGNAVAIVYTIKETTGYPGYTSSDSSLSAGVTSGQSITNTQETTSATATKAWLNADGTTTAPSGANVVFTLYADGTATSYIAILDAQSGWTANFSSIPMYQTGTTTPIIYTVKETTTYPGYDSSDSSLNSGVASGATITNTQRTTTVTVSKAWANADGTTATAPAGASVVFTLYADGTATGQTATLNAQNGWTATFSNLPECRTGTNTQIVYKVKETTPYPGYTSNEPSDGVGNNGTITNTQNTVSLVIAKQVSGNMANRLKDFDFTVTLSGTGYTPPASMPYTKTAANGTTTTGTLSLTNDAYAFTLRHGEQIELAEVQIGTQAVIAEDKAEYTPTMTSADLGGTPDVTNGTYTVSSVPTDGGSVTFNNYYNVTIPTGEILDSLPYILLMILAMVGITSMIAKRTSKRKN